MQTALILALAAPAAGFSFGNTKTSAQTYVSPFKDMPGAYGWAAEKGLAYSFGKPFSQQKFPDLVNWVQEAEIKHARVAMLAALGYPVAEVFHPLWGGSINEPSLIAFQATPLQTFWPIVVGAIGLIESASYISAEQAGKVAEASSKKEKAAETAAKTAAKALDAKAKADAKARTAAAKASDQAKDKADKETDKEKQAKEQEKSAQKRRQTAEKKKSEAIEAIKVAESKKKKAITEEEQRIAAAKAAAMAAKLKKQKAKDAEEREEKVDMKKKMSAEAETKLVVARIKALEASNKKLEDQRVRKESAEKTAAATAEKVNKMNIAAEKTTKLKKLVQSKIDKERADKKAAELAKAKAKEAADKKAAAEASAREKSRKDTLAEAAALEKKRQAEKEKYVQEMKKLEQERSEQLNNAVAHAKRIGQGIKDLETKIIAAKAQAGKSSGARRKIALAAVAEHGLALKRSQTQFDEARSKIREVRNLHEAARKALEDAKTKCESCGEYKFAHSAAQEVAIAKAKAVELAQKGEVIKVDDPKAEARIKGDREAALRILLEDQY